MNKNTLSLVGITLIAFIAFLEYTVVNTALPTIQDEFHVSVLTLQWVFNIYSIVLAIFMIIGGRLGDMYGRRLLFYIGVLLLAIGSLGAGLCHNFWLLVFFRGIQGLGSAVSFTLSASLINSIYKDQATGPMSIFAAVTGLGLAIGPFVGGWLVMHLGWRWIFFINIPLLFLAFICCLPCLGEYKAEKKISLDVGGTALLAITLVGLIYGLIHGEQVAWQDPLTIGLFAAFIIGLPTLIIYENRLTDPILDFHFFKIPNFTLSAFICMLGGTLISASLFFSPLYLQRVLDYTPKTAGLYLLAVPIAIVFLAPFVGKLIEKITLQKTLFLALLLGAVASVLYLLFAINSSIVIALIAFLATGFSWSIINSAAAIGAASSVEEHQISVATGTVFSMWNIAAAVTVAINTLLFHWGNIAHQNLGKKLAFIQGFEWVFAFILVVSIALVLGGYFMTRIKLKA